VLEPSNFWFRTDAKVLSLIFVKGASSTEEGRTQKKAQGLLGRRRKAELIGKGGGGRRRDGSLERGEMAV